MEGRAVLSLLRVRARSEGQSGAHRGCGLTKNVPNRGNYRRER